jgi:thioredoxin reductase
MEKIHDVLIVGGSYAGLQAAMTLGRCLRNVLVIDSGKPSNRFAPQAHNLITYDDVEPDKIRRWAKEQVLTYPTVSIREGNVLSVELNDDGTFTALDNEGNNHKTKKLLLATGLTDVLPDIPGFEQCWGRSVVHCPYCHGYEVRGKKLGVMAGAKATERFLPLVHNWSDDLSFFLNEDEELTEETERSIIERNINIVRSGIRELHHTDGYLERVVTADGTPYTLDALFVSLPCEQQTEIVEQLGCETNEDGFIEINIVGSTNVPGVYAAGDCTTPMRAISVAIASGYQAGIGINNELLKEGIK